jgi:CubicO group peptidase (beta-lactamase class C family)
MKDGGQKVLVATIVLQLKEADKLDLQDKVGEYLEAVDYVRFMESILDITSAP